MASNLQGILPTRSQFFSSKTISLNSSLWRGGCDPLKGYWSDWVIYPGIWVNNDEVNKGEQRWSEQKVNNDEVNKLNPRNLPPSGYYRLPSLPPPTNCLVVRLRDGEPNNGSASRLVVNSPQNPEFRSVGWSGSFWQSCGIHVPLVVQYSW